MCKNESLFPFTYYKSCDGCSSTSFIKTNGVIKAFVILVFTKFWVFTILLSWKFKLWQRCLMYGSIAIFPSMKVTKFFSTTEECTMDPLMLHVIFLVAWVIFGWPKVVMLVLSSLSLLLAIFQFLTSLTYFWKDIIMSKRCSCSTTRYIWVPFM